MEIKLVSTINMWRNGKGIGGELVATDEGLIFHKRGFLATYYNGLIPAIAELATTKLNYFAVPYEEIQSAVRGRFRLNWKALIVTLKSGEEIIFALSDKHKKWFALMDEMVNKKNTHV